MNLKTRKLQNLFLTLMLIVAMALTVAGCGNKSAAQGTSQQVENTSAGQTSSEDAQAPANQGTDQQQEEGTGAGQPSLDEELDAAGVTVLGEGATKIMFVVVDGDGNETNFEIHTDKETVGDALLEQQLIAGDESEYGLYVKQVNGITADYDVDQTYWAFYIDGEYATSGVDSTAVKEGETYSFKIEK